MNILYSIGDKVDSSVYDFVSRKGLPIDLNVRSHCDFETFLSKLTSHDCVIVENVSAFQLSMLGLLKALKNAVDKNIRIISADGKIDICNNQKTLEMLEAYSVACEIDSAYRSSKTRRALAVSKQNGKVLGRKKGWRKKRITETSGTPAMNS